ncbi:MAG: hypothetical protein M4579_004596 [Chaenotheca gracillima]|nr:MAG: hypothetical protein M4579_004596 [Chaenotheca gracillima]
MESSDSLNDNGPIFYVGHHETQRQGAVTESTLRMAQDCGYDMMTAPITTPHFQAHVLSILSLHLSLLSEVDNSASSHELPPPIIPPFTPQDSNLSPGDTITQLVAVSSPWIDLSSPDPLIANISRQILNLEIAYAAFCGVGNIMIAGPKLQRKNGARDGLTQYARAVQEALQIGSFVSIQVCLPIAPLSIQEAGDDEMGSLAHFTRKEYAAENDRHLEELDMFQSWDAWNVIRTVCKYNSRLFVGLSLPRQLPSLAVQNRWFAEPIRLLTMHISTFIPNKTGYPVLGKSHQSLISRYMRLRTAPWILLEEVGPIPGSVDPDNTIPNYSDQSSSPSATSDADRSASPLPTPAEAATMPAKRTHHSGAKQNRKDLTPHLSYIRYLQRTQQPRNAIEQFGSGYQDYLQAPLQPLADNLESMTYEVFEKDPVKYDWYERAIAAALNDWTTAGRPGSGPSSEIVVAVVGAGRGPLVTRALRASESVGVDIDLWAVEKNPNAYVVLQRHNEFSWSQEVKVVKSDMRSWQGPDRGSSHGKVDIIISELLGSFADNELSPECLDGVQHVLQPEHGISIPSSYTAHLTPISAPRLYADISTRTNAEPTAPEIPYVVMLHAIDYLSTFATSDGPQPLILEAWEFIHPVQPSVLAQSHTRRGAGISGGGGGQMAGGDGANEHNARFAQLRFPCRSRGECTGLGGYFEATLFRDVELSTRPDRIDAKSKDMISWFPIYFPLKAPLYFPDNSELDVSIWRQTDDRKVWYEWMVEAFVVIAERKIRVGCSELHSSRKNGCLM